MKGTSLGAERIVQALSRGLERGRRLLREEKSSIPEFLLYVDLFQEGLDCLRARSPEWSPGRSVGVVIGVVEGDIHDMGKNIVAAVLEASGYSVHDVGRDVPRETFLDAIETTGASLLALSTMMSTTQESMRGIIQWTRRLYPQIGILVGGASLDEKLAGALGADGYAESALTAPDEAARIVAMKKSGKAHCANEGAQD